MSQRYRRWLSRKTAERCAKNLKRNGFDAFLVQNTQEAHDLILGMVSEFETFGFGGSETVRELGLVEELQVMGKTVYDHWRPGLSAEEVQHMRIQQLHSDCFLCSANAISAQGEIVNVDSIGNRVSAMVFGPRKVMIVAGSNKIAPDLDGALRRVREVAGPMRAKSLGMETPCASNGECTDCHAPQRICRITTILHRKPMLTDTAVVLINQDLGF